MLSHDAQLLNLGAAIALISSLITIFTQDWVSARRKKRDRQEEIDKPTVVTVKDLETAGVITSAVLGKISAGELVQRGKGPEMDDGLAEKSEESPSDPSLSE